VYSQLVWYILFWHISLQILTPEGRFVPVPPIEGTIVVNIGDLMQRWTGNKLRATVGEVAWI